MSLQGRLARRILALFLIDIASVWLAIVLWLAIGLGIISGMFPSLSEIFFDAESSAPHQRPSEYLWHIFLIIGIPTLVILTLQIILLAPVLGKPSIQPGKGRSIIASGVIAGLVAAVLLSGIAIAVGEWILAETRTFKDPRNFDNAALVNSTIIFLIALPISWAFFGVLFSLTLLRARSPYALQRLVSTILIASAAEYVLLIPINIVINRRSECFCVQGSFLALGFSVAALAVLLGPFFLLIFCNHRYRNQARAHARSESND